MTILPVIIVVLAAFLVLVGLLTLILAWFAPRFLDHPTLQWLITGKRIPPTRANRTLGSIWAILIGSFFLLSLSGQHTISYIVFAAWVPFAVAVLRLNFKFRAAA